MNDMQFEDMLGSHDLMQAGVGLKARIVTDARREAGQGRDRLTFGRLAAAALVVVALAVGTERRLDRSIQHTLAAPAPQPVRGRRQSPQRGVRYSLRVDSIRSPQSLVQLLELPQHPETRSHEELPGPKPPTDPEARIQDNGTSGANPYA